MTHQYTNKKISYILIMDNKEVGNFSEMSGYNKNLEFQKTNNPLATHFDKLGLIKQDCLFLKVGIVLSAELLLWLQDNTCQRKTITIKLCEDTKNVVAQWRINNAFPVKYILNNNHPNHCETIIEHLEIAHEGIQTIQ